MAGNVSEVLRRVGPNLANTSVDEFTALTDVPLFLGYVFSYFLDGILIVQIFLYYLSFRRTDHIFLRTTVFTIFFAQLLSSVIAVDIIIMSMIRFGDLANSIHTLGFKIVALLCGLCITMVHVFYCWRIRMLKGSWWIVVAVMVLSVLQCITVMMSGFGVFQGQYTGFLGAGTETLNDSASLSLNVSWLAGNTIAGIMIATTLLFLRKRRPLPWTATRVETVMGATVGTGMITAVATCIELMFFLLLPDSLVHFVMFYALPKLYANCLMSTLNGHQSDFEKDSFGLHVWSQGHLNLNGDSHKKTEATSRHSLCESVILDVKRLSSSETPTMQPLYSHFNQPTTRTPSSNPSALERHGLTTIEFTTGRRSTINFKDIVSVHRSEKKLVSALSYSDLKDSKPNERLFVDSGYSSNNAESERLSSRSELGRLLIPEATLQPML